LPIAKAKILAPTLISRVHDNDALKRRQRFLQ